MTSCGLYRKGLREQFVAKSDGAEYVRCSNRACGYFCSLDELATYQRVVQLDEARTFRSGDAPLCQHQRACALRVSRSVKNAGRLYFTCRERWPHVFLLGRSGSELAPASQPADPLKKSPLPFFWTESVCYENSIFLLKNCSVCSFFLF